MLNFNWIDFGCMILNVLILYAIMKKFLFGRVDKVLATRKDEIEKQYVDAQNQKDDAEKLHKEYEKHLTDIASEREKVMQEASANATAEYKKVLEEAQAKAGDIIDKARKNAELEKEKAKKDQEAQIEELVLSVASKMIGGRNTEEDNQKLYDNFLTKAGSNEAGGNK